MSNTKTSKNFNDVIKFIAFNGNMYEIKQDIFSEFLSSDKNNIIFFYYISDKLVIFDTNLNNVTKKIVKYLEGKLPDNRIDIIYTSKSTNILNRCFMFNDICYDTTLLTYFHKTKIKYWMECCDTITY